MRKNAQSGFTLVELAIVLVIIGLIVGGVLVGQDLIRAATVRAAVSQIEKYDTAANTFHNKYNGIPGDLVNPTRFFASVVNTTGANGEADGDGLVEGTSDSTPTLCTTEICVAGEAAIFWYELNQAGYISEAITTADAQDYTLTVSDVVLPPSKLGKGARIAIGAFNGRNYYSLANFGSSALVAGSATYTAGLSPIDAYNIDAKMDDSVPNSGKVMSIALATALPTTAATGTTAGTNLCYASSLYSTTGTNAEAIQCSLGIRTSY